MDLGEAGTPPDGGRSATRITVTRHSSRGRNDSVRQQTTRRRSRGHDLAAFDIRPDMVTRVGRLPHPVSDAAADIVGEVGYLIDGEPQVPVASIASLAAR